MYYKKTISILLFVITFLSITNIGYTQTFSTDSWTKYCGWHYAQTPPIWGGWVREYAKDGFGVNISDTITYQIDTVALENSYQTLLALDTTIDILQLCGGLISAKDTTRVINYMNMIEADNGLKWKDIVFKQSKKLTQLPNAQNRVFWQLGNEISSSAYSRTIRYWQGEPYSNGTSFDSYIIPYYVENYLAPTIEAIDSASLDVYGQTGKIKICLGSLTSGANPNAVTFLNTLLNYQISGTNAPTLAGLKVSDLVHLITIHYTMATQTSDWESVISNYKSWTGTGRIEGVWSTEEVGINAALAGLGSFSGSISTSRYLEWSIDNQYTSKEVRVNYYGWNTGDPVSTINALNNFIYDSIGDTKLANVPPSSTSVNALNGVEYHSFMPQVGNKAFMVLFPERVQNQLTAEINDITFDHSGWGNIQSITAYTYNDLGINLTNSSLSQLSNTSILSFGSPHILDVYDGLLVFVNTENLLSLNDLNAKEGISIYPNPTNNNVTIEIMNSNSSFSGEIILFNSIGQEVVRTNLLSNKMNLNLELQTGVYFVKVIDNKGFVVAIEKLIIK